MNNMQTDFNKWFRDGLDLYRDHFKTLLVASGIALGVSIVSLGVLAGPMMAGLTALVLGLRDNQTPEPRPGDVFKGFSWFLQSFLFLLAWGLATVVASAVLSVVPILGHLAGGLVGFVVGTVFIFGLPLIVDRDMDFWTASMESLELVKKNFWPFLALFVVTSLIAMAGWAVFMVGAVATVPIQVCVVVAAYREFYER